MGLGITFDSHLCFTVYGKPHGKGRPRHSKSGAVYTPKETKDYEAQIGWRAKKNMGATDKQLTILPISLIVDIYVTPLTKMKKADKETALAGFILPVCTPDVDNILKSIMDGLNGIVYEDDKQVVHASVSKQYAPEPKVEVTIGVCNDMS